MAFNPKPLGLHLFLLLGIFIGFPSLAQEPQTRVYGIENGLPSLESYQVKVDSKGFVWVATDRGVSRFDGTEFKTFNQKDGLEQLTIFAMAEDNHQRMWFAALGGTLFYHEEGTFHAFAQNELLTKTLRNYTINNLVVIDDTVWLGVYGYGMVRITTDGKVTGSDSLTYKCNALYYQVRPGQFVSSLLNQRTKLLPHSPFLTLFKVVGNDTQKIHVPLKRDERFLGHRISMHSTSSGDLVMAMLGNAYLLESGGQATKLYDEIWASSDAMYEDLDGYIWTGSIRNGVRKLDPRNGCKTVGHYLDGQSITSVAQDHEGGMWFSSIESGLIYMPNPHLLNIPASSFDSESKLIDMTLCNGNLYVSTYSGKIQRIDLAEEGVAKFTNIESFNKQGEGKSLACHWNQLIAIGAYGGFYGDESSALEIEEIGLRLDFTDSLLYSAYGGIIIHNSDFQIIPTPEVRAKAYETAIGADDEGNVWLGTAAGLQMYRDGELNDFGAEEPFKARVADIDATHLVFVATLGYGVICIDPVTKDYSLIDQSTGLPSDNCTSVYHDDQGNLWIGTSEGLCLLAPNGQGGWNLIKTFTSYDGVMNGEVLRVMRDDSIVWVLTQNGISRIDLSQPIHNSYAPPARITETLHLERDSSIRITHNKLQHFENNIELRFGSITYRNALEVEYSYRLLGLDSMFSSTREGKVSYTALPPGDYIFQVKAANNDGLMSSSPAEFSFTIAPAYWQTWWFRLLLIFTFLLIITTGFWLRYRIKNRQLGLQLAVLENEQKALTAQINPHFIYNAMNSVQYYVLEGERSKAADQLAQFSELMRSVLSNTKSSFITLESELNIIRLYLGLEKERFEQRFDFELMIDDSIDPEQTIIPSMIIQPHVENAIWHGLLGKAEGTGKLSIRLRREKDEIVWSIKDNGVGRNALKQKKPGAEKARFTSSGINLTSRRLDLLAEKTGKSYGLKIEDLKDDNGSLSGTEVIITMATKPS